MSKYTEQQLNAMNKTSLVSLAIELGLQLVSFQLGPLKGSDVEKTMLDLARQAANIKSNDDARQKAHVEALAKIEADKAIAIKKMELEFADSRGLEAAALEEAYKTIEEKSKLAIEELSFGLKKAEIENEQAIEKLQDELKVAKEKYSEALKESETAYNTAVNKMNTELAKLQQDHTREMEQVQYDNKIALRDEKLSSAETIAKLFNKVLIDASELAELQAEKTGDEASITATIEAAVKAATSEVYAKEGAKYNALKSSSESEIALLQKDKEYLSATITSLQLRIVSMDNQITAFPGQLKDAVEAAKADVTINQDNKK